jgi:hypothetical protein
MPVLVSEESPKGEKELQEAFNRTINICVEAMKSQGKVGRFLRASDT